MEERRKLLHDYLLGVTRDLVMRGVLRKQSGQTIAEIFNAETQMVLSSAIEDLKSVGKDMLGGLVGGLVTGALSSLLGSKKK